MLAPGVLVLDEAGADDEPFLDELFLAVRPHLHLTGLDAAALAALVGMQRRAQRMSYAQRWPGYRQFVARLDGHPVATISRADSADLVHILDLGVLPAWQGRGVGAALLTGVLEGTSVPVSLTVAAQNPARALYARLGFVEAGQSGTDLLMLAPARDRQAAGGPAR